MPRPHDDEAPGAAAWRRLWPLAALVALLVAALLTDVPSLVSLEALQQRHAFLMEWTAAHPFASRGLFLLAAAGLMAIGFPIIAVITFAGGLLFGVWTGLALSLVGGTAGGLVFFLAARHARGAALSSWRLSQAFAWIESGFRGNELLSLLTLRLVPVFPTAAVTLAAAAAHMNTRDFLVASFLGAAPAAFIYASLGASASALIVSGEELQSALMRPELFAPLFGLACLGLLAVWLRRRAARD